MEIKFLGGNCFKISSKKATLVIDDVINSSGGSVSSDKDILLRTQKSSTPSSAHFLIDGPGEYEVSEVSIKGIPARAHIDQDAKSRNSTIYRVQIDDVRICVLGHIYPELTDEMIEDIGIIDILLVPVGGNGYTLDAVGASKIIKNIEPKIAVPSNYDDGKTKYEVPQSDLEAAIKNMGMEPADRVEALKIKPAELIAMGDNTRLIVIQPK